jgi:short-subunit dehydrogenase involved in D-alanine esterification of teichoic acids
LGAARVIPHEQENLTVRVVDVDEKVAGFGVEGLADLSERLLREAMFGREPEVGLRGRVRYAPGVAPQPLPPCRSSAVCTEVSSRPSVRPEPVTGPTGPDLLPFGRGGFWWITGGLGGVGLALASRLAVGQGEKLLLTSRSGLPPREQWQALSRETNERGRRIRLVLELEGQGAEILVLAADAADRVQMEQALAAAKERFGHLSGVIHAAGLADEGGVLRRRTREETLPVLAPKVAGSLLLRGIARREQAPLVLCSSLGNLLPATKFAQTGYAAANEFLDLLADREPEARILNINWDDWSEAGMSVRAAENWRERHHLGAVAVPRSPGLSPDEGWEAFCRALASGLPRVAVSVRDLYQLMDDRSLSARGFAEHLTTAHSRPDVGIPFETPLPGLETELAAIWGEVLGISSVGAQDDFFELGGHSLLSTQMAALVQQRLGLFLPINAIFDTPVLRNMAARLAAAVPPPEAAQTGPEEEMEEDVF